MFPFNNVIYKIKSISRKIFNMNVNLLHLEKNKWIEICPIIWNQLQIRQGFVRVFEKRTYHIILEHSDMTVKISLQFHAHKISFSLSLLVAAERGFCLQSNGTDITCWYSFIYQVTFTAELIALDTWRHLYERNIRRCAQDYNFKRFSLVSLSFCAYSKNVNKHHHK